MRRRKWPIVGVLSLWLLGGCQSDQTNWQHLDLKDDGVFGISTDKAYKELLKGKASTPVIVAIMDSGFDIEHEDLKPNLWVNEHEIPNNGVDDDDNGYIDDVHGWNFTGSTKESADNATAILTCLVVRDQERFSNVSYADLSVADRADFEIYQKNKSELEKKRQEAADKLAQLEKLKIALDKIVEQLGTKTPTLEDFRAYAPKNEQENRARSFVNGKMKRKTFKEVCEEDIQDRIDTYQSLFAYAYNTEYTPPSLDDDHPHNKKGRFYGNGGLEGPYPKHGSHVAGIIGADRTNNLGIQGVADNVRIMPILFMTLNGREVESTTAKAIRYAADQGAKIINMSFGDFYTWDKAVVDEAVKYALSKDVLFIQAAGNDNKNLEEIIHYPNPYYLDGGKAESWITVGASDKSNDETLRASFSNYGKTQVDVFAPGVRINSTMPGSTYKRMDGTSMSAPLVAGVAALVRSYYPALTAVQVKEIILKSVSKADQLKDRCVTGGIVNAYTALQLAEEYKGKQAPQ